MGLELTRNLRRYWQFSRLLPCQLGLTLHVRPLVLIPVPHIAFAGRDIFVFFFVYHLFYFTAQLAIEVSSHPLMVSATVVTDNAALFLVIGVKPIKRQAVKLSFVLTLGNFEASFIFTMFAHDKRLQNKNPLFILLQIYYSRFISIYPELFLLFSLVPRKGFEPLTNRLEGGCSYSSELPG